MDFVRVLGLVEKFVDSYDVYLFLVLLAVNVLAVSWVLILKRQLEKIFKGPTRDLERVLLELRDHQEIGDKVLKALEKKVMVLEEELPRDLRKVGLVRFNPFSDSGGDQSFSVALLNDNKDGVVISSLYGREINRIYAKSVKEGKSPYQLTEEEKMAIDQAA